MSLYCNNCKSGISTDVFDYSTHHYGRALCMSCQRSTPEARKLADALNKLGWQAELEKPVSKMHVDISVKRAKVNIEVDGLQHTLDIEQALSDLKRTCFTFNRFWITLRVPNSIIRDDGAFGVTVEYINNYLIENEKQLKGDWLDTVCDFLRKLFKK